MFVPVKVTVLSRHERLAEEVATRLKEQGFGDTVTAVGEPDGMRIRYHPSIDRDHLRLLGCALRPHRLVAEPDASLRSREAAAIVELGSEAEAEGICVEIASDMHAFGARVKELLAEEGFAVAQPVIRAVCTKPQVLYGDDVGEFEKCVLRSCLSELGIEAAFQAWPIEGVLIQARDPALAHVRARELFEVHIRSDDADAASQLAGLLGTDGFQLVETSIREEEPHSDRILIDPGPFSGALDRAGLLASTHRICRLLDVDEARFPVELLEEVESSSHATIHLPIASCRAGSLRPYAGTDLERIHVRIITNGGPAPIELNALLEEGGFRPPTEEVEGDGRLGYAIHYGEAARTSLARRVVECAVRTAMAGVGASPEFPLHTYDTHAAEAEILIYFPTEGLEDGSLREACSQSAPYALTLIAEEASRLEPWLEELRTWGWAGSTVQTAATPRDPHLQYGGAPALLLERIADWVFEKTGRSLRMTREWPLHDNDLYLSLPRSCLPSADPAAAVPTFAGTGPASATQVDAYVEGAEACRDVRPLIYIAEEHVRFADFELPVRPGPRHALAPDPSAFEHFCIDSQTAGILSHVAASTLLTEPCLLEGETSTSKTSSILYIAQLMNQPVMRINLSGQTDTGELIGRYAPAGGLTGDDATSGTTWCWQDGLVVQAMRQGWWLLLDEINLAEPQILERLNSVLELQPSLVLTEHDNSVLGPGGEPVDERFRLFATMNPAEYAGRSTLSPAYRNRWRGHLICPQPGEREYRQMLGQLVLGDVPRVKVGTGMYVPATVASPAAKLASVVGIGFLLDALARFHASIEAATAGSGQVQLGSGRRERYVFTRRDLLSVIGYIAYRDPEASREVAARAIREAIQRYYLSRVVEGEDRDIVVHLLDAAGIGPNAWHMPDVPVHMRGRH